ncbi:hypothetical protein NGM37_53035, partial [Streptomyces sp. TRM76130]|nr:hypothetical protein [Streptomyces sp. TRM76130]
MAGAAERVEWDDFETNSAEAREQLAQERTTPRAYLRRRAASQLDDKVYAEMAASIKITNKDVLLNQYIAQLYSCL